MHENSFPVQQVSAAKNFLETPPQKFWKHEEWKILAWSLRKQWYQVSISNQEYDNWKHWGDPIPDLYVPPPPPRLPHSASASGQRLLRGATGGGGGDFFDLF